VTSLLAIGLAPHPLAVLAGGVLVGLALVLPMVSAARRSAA
jgi:hypothetical protein